jgi:UDP-glucuronate decarboxylase
MVDHVLVTGGSGFIGSHLCESLLDDGCRVFCLDNLSSGRRTNVEHLVGHDDFDFVDADVRDPGPLPDVDLIYHLASRASPDDFKIYPIDIALTNAEGIRVILDHAVDQDARMVFASTSEVYGDPEVHPQPETYNGNVNPRGIRACYDESKRFGETLAVAYEREYDLDVRTVRIFNTYGPRMRMDDGRVVPTFLSQALADEALTVYGDGTQTRSFCYVGDLVRGIRATMDVDGLAGEVVNLGHDDEITILELADTVCEVLDADVRTVHEPLPEDDPHRRQPDIDKARDLLGWEPEVSLVDGLERTAASYPD